MNDNAPLQTNAAAVSVGPGAAPPEPRDADDAPRAARKAGLLSQNLLLIVLFLLALAGLYLLSRWRGGPEKASAEVRNAELQVDNALARLSIDGKKSKSVSVKSIVDAFYCQAHKRQIPLEEMKGNPFTFVPVRAKVKVAPKTAAPQAHQQVRAERELAEAMEAVKSLKLSTVMISPTQKVAIISNNLLSVGQKISGWTVAGIEPGRVVMRFRKHEYELKMPEPKLPG